MGQLNLKHYIPEAAKSIAQGKFGAKDYHQTVEICVLLHQRYEEFASKLIPAIVKQFGETPISEFNKKRNILRTLTELYFKGLTQEYQVIFKCLARLTLIKYQDCPDEFQSGMLVLSDYMKTYGEPIFLALSRESRESIDGGYEVTIQRHDFLGPQRRKKLVEYLVKNYYENTCLAFANERYKEVKHAQQQWEDNLKETAIEERFEEAYLRLKVEFQRLLELVGAMADVLDVDVPEYKIEEDKAKQTQMVITKKSAAAYSGPGGASAAGQEVKNSFAPYSDELEHQFYAQLPDLKRFADAESDAMYLGEGDEEELAARSAKAEQELEDLGRNLTKSQSLYQIDQRAEECIKRFRGAHYRAARKRIASALFNVPRHQHQILPFYSRFAAIISTYHPEVGAELIRMLDQEFREIQEQNDVVKVETKVRNIRFIGELTKFGMYSPTAALDCLKTCLDSFIGHNLDLISNLLETCGPFLTNSPDEAVSRRVSNLLDFMWRLKEKEAIPSAQMNNLVGAYYLCRPSKGPAHIFAKKNESLTVVQQYIQHLFLERIPKAASYHATALPPQAPATAEDESLEAGEPRGPADEPQAGDDGEAKNDLDSVLSYILALPWRDNEDFIFRQVLLLISTARFNDMECIAIMLAALKEQHRNFLVAVMDHAFEQVVRGIEENDFKDAQRRVSAMKFIAECYNYKVIHSDTLFCLLYKLINWDIYGDCEDKRMAQYDDAGDCFRIRLVCTVLDSLGKYFLKHKRRLLMDRFLIFFQRYIYEKNYILMDLEFMLLDTMDYLRPKQAPKVANLAEARDACQRIRQAEASFLKPCSVTDDYPEEDTAASAGRSPGASVVEVIGHYCYAWQQKDKRGGAAADKADGTSRKGQTAKQRQQDQEAADLAYDVYGDGAAENPPPTEDAEKGEEDGEAGTSEGEQAKDDGGDGHFGADEKEAILKQRKQIIDELDKKEVEDFDEEFRAML